MVKWVSLLGGAAMLTVAVVALPLLKPDFFGLGASKPPRLAERTAGPLKSVWFDFVKYNIRPGDAKTLNRNAAWAQIHNEVKIRILGFHDPREDRAGVGLAISGELASAVKEYLVANGVDQKRLITEGMGSRRPPCITDDEGCWVQYRRVDLEVVSD
jgi:peptidoglycan-associated lipoprotein